METVGYERRVLSYLVDKAISWTGFGLLFWLFLTIMPHEVPPFLSFILALFAGHLIYFILYFCFMKAFSSSLGMLIFRVKSVHLSGVELDTKEVAIRAILSSFFAFGLANAAYMLIVHTERSVFDQLTESYEVRR